MKKPEKIDLYKLHKNDYVTPRKPVLVQIGTAVYLSIEGKGEPGGIEFSDKIGALYAVAYTVKMKRKFSGQQDYSVSKLEGQYWCGRSGIDFATVPKSEWQWNLMIRTPEFITPREVEQAIEGLLGKGKSPAVARVALETLMEGRCVQMLHVGPYDRELESIALMKSLAQSEGLELRNRHHEVYLSDPRRVAPERLRTILRIPVAPAKS